MLKEHLKYRVINPLRYARDSIKARKIFQTGGARPVRVALVSDGLAYCSEEQFHPFEHYRERLRDDRTIITIEMRLDDVLTGAMSLANFDVVGLKMTYRTDEDTALSVAAQVASLASGAKLFYFDGDDDLCVQWPGVAHLVDTYVKKHVFSDRQCYSQTFAGKSNLHDYVHKTYGHEFSPSDYGNANDAPVLITRAGPLPKDAIDKIQLGWNIALDQKIMDLYEELHEVPIDLNREYDLTFRGSVKPGTVTYYLRKDVEAKLAPLADRYKLLIGAGKVSQQVYNNELRQSKICVSPFGFGELCWRDFEAVLFGTMLIKPDMSHVTTSPDIFVAGETYAPVLWDYSNLEEVCTYYIENEAERRRIASNAHQKLVNYYDQAKFLDVVERLLRGTPVTAN